MPFALVWRTLHVADTSVCYTETEPVQLRLHSPCIPNHNLYEQLIWCQSQHSIYALWIRLLYKR